uniref:Polymerase nucleotidyl transferase domain-containing protein n=1 Tax=Kalanchoe fedtschenkoi TaxID=63787 RepID=A0A7N0ZQR2_KALFE
MDSKQMMDALTGHMSLYHASIPATDSHHLTSPRSSILKWFSSLALHHRLAALTTVDHAFVQVLLKMLSKLSQRGHGCFILLPDLPSDENPLLPTLCFRKSEGLLGRVCERDQAERAIWEATRLFQSREGESVEDCSCSAADLDAVTFGEELVEDVVSFVEVMDKVSGEGFLRGEGGGLCGDWVELSWLKGKGYYGIEAFVANRMEVSLRLAWLNYSGGKKRGAKLKEKVDVVGVAANVYWRKKGFVDWWEKLDASARRNVVNAILGKKSKALIAEVTTVEKSDLKNEMRFSGRAANNKERYKYTMQCQMPRTVVPALGFSSICMASTSSRSTSFENVVKGLLLLQDIYTVSRCCDSDKERLYFSKFDSVNSSLDCIFRKIRGLLMAISLQSTKLELLDEGNTDIHPSKLKVRSVPGNRRKKGRPRDVKRPDLVSELKGDECKLDSCIIKDDVTRSSIHLNNNNVGEPKTLTTKLQDCKDDHLNKAASVKFVSASRKNRKDRKKKKKACVNDSEDERNPRPMLKHAALPKANPQITTETKNSNSSVVQNGDTAMLNVHCLSPTNVSGKMEDIAGSSLVIDSPRAANNLDESPSDASKMIDSECVTNYIDSPRKAYVPDPELACKFRNGDSSFQNPEEIKTRPGCEIIGSRENMIRKQQERGNFSDSGPTTSGYISYEWPIVSQGQTSVTNSYLPAATDRLHLDVGHNWHTHFHRSFVPPMHQARNLSIQSGHNRVFPLPVPMSIDWPPVVRGFSRVAPSVACSYDSGFISRRQSSFHRAFTSQHLPINSTTTEDERKYAVELSDLTSNQEAADECDGLWITEEELKLHAVPAYDYNQYFGGGVMYWNPSDHTAGGVSRPPSLSSDDSSWAWHEAEMRQDVDDMVAFSSSYSTNGLTSPTATSFCSPFDPLGTGTQAIGYVIQGKDKTGKVLHPSSISDAKVEERDSGASIHIPDDIEGKSANIHPYPILPPIIIPSTSRERSRSELRGHDYITSSVSQDPPQITRPPSPMVLCVSRAPRLPLPSSVSDSRRQKGFPSVRSGSSSPRNWSLRSIYSDGTKVDETFVCMDGQEVVWPWRNNNIAACPMVQPISGALLQDRLIAISQLAREKDHPDIAFPLQRPEGLNDSNHKPSLNLMYNLLQDEIESFCQKVASKNMIRKPYINWAVKRVRRSLQVLWPRSRTIIFGSNATGLSLPSSDVDLVVSLPPVRNLEPIKEAGILEGRNGIKETCLQHAARYLANQEWVKSDSLKTVENTAIPIIMLVVDVPRDLVSSLSSNVRTMKPGSLDLAELGHVNSASVDCSRTGSDFHKDPESVRLDISFKSSSHTGLQTTDLVKQLTEHFPAATPLALVLKQFLADRSLDQSYSGGLSSYCLVIIITRFLQHEHHLGQPINQNFGKLLMDFLYFFGNVFDPRQMRISVQGTGLYMKRERGHGIDPIHIDDPLSPTNNVGRNCFRIHQCIKAFADAYSILEQELGHFMENENYSSCPLHKLLPKIIPSIDPQ